VIRLDVVEDDHAAFVEKGSGRGHIRPHVLVEVRGVDMDEAVSTRARVIENFGARCLHHHREPLMEAKVVRLERPPGQPSVGVGVFGTILFVACR
jgi:hypothetical protein